MSRAAIAVVVVVVLNVVDVGVVDAQPFACATRCQCYADTEQPSFLHLICKWDQLNATNLNALHRTDLVRTLTIRCPHHSRRKSSPPIGLFRGLHNLDRLELDRCQISVLPEGIFAGLTQLYSLIIKNANLTEVPRNIFAHVPNLMTLDMSGNRLRIEPHSLRHLTNLINLDLSDNQISFFTNTLVSLTKLRVITMNRNQITNIDFRRLPEELSDLSLRNNKISTLHYVPNSARYLRRLDLAGNLIEYISGLTGSVNVLPPGLKFVDISSNKIHYLHEIALHHMGKLAFIDLQNNSLREVKEASLRGSKMQLRVYVAGNPLRCHCSARWMLHAEEKNTPTVVDLSAVMCESILPPFHSTKLIFADARNELLCKYSSMCEEDCECCENSTCDCKIECPKYCQCHHSANTSSIRTAQNVIVCDALRLDKLDLLPSTTTDLRLNDADWKTFSVEQLSKLPRLKSLSITNSPLTEEELVSLGSLKNLTHLDLSASSLTRVPDLVASLGHLTHLRLHSNSLTQLSSESLRRLEPLKKVTLGGNHTLFACSCDSPSDLQLWLAKKFNREKVEDLDDVYCDLAEFGVVRVAETLAGNESLCAEMSEDTKTWLTFVDNVKHLKIEDDNEKKEEKVTNEDEGTSTSTSMKGEGTTTLEPSTRKSTTSTSTSTTTTPTTLTMTSTRSRPRKKYDDDDDEPLQFVNVLIFILFVTVIVLIIAIGFTIYFKFLNGDDVEKHRRHREEQPLSE